MRYRLHSNCFKSPVRLSFFPKNLETICRNDPNHSSRNRARLPNVCIRCAREGFVRYLRTNTIPHDTLYGYSRTFRNFFIPAGLPIYTPFFHFFHAIFPRFTSSISRAYIIILSLFFSNCKNIRRITLRIVRVRRKRSC